MTSEEENLAGLTANRMASVYAETSGAFSVEVEDLPTATFNPEMLKLMLRVLRGYGLEFRVYPLTEGRSRWTIYKVADYRRWVAQGKPDFPSVSALRVVG